VKKIQICFVLGILALFLGWLPKLRAEHVFWFLDNDFAHFYLTGKLISAGLNPYAINLAPLYAEEGFTPTFSIPSAGAPPALGILWSLFAPLPPFVAFVTWTVIQIGSLLLGTVVLMRSLGMRQSGDHLAAALFGVLAPLGMFMHIRYGQAQALMFLLLVVGLVLMRRDEKWAWRGGVVLWGIAASLKLFTLPMVCVALRYRGREAVVWFLVGVLALPSLFVAWCGSEGLYTFVAHTLPYLRDLSLAFTANISLSGALAHSQRIVWGEALLTDRTTQAISLALFIPILVLEWREARDLVASTMTILTAACLLSPTSWPHYLPLLTGGFIYLVACGLRAKRPEVALWTVLALFLCLGATVGYVPRGDLLMQLVSAWWGALGMIAMLLMIFCARRRIGVFV
jgi:Glycosyltransferase family 87